ncbi:NADAR family protein [Chryseobacterium sp.]|uniref:NADAR family protein n=1 Tax=Chryseobacterium sp. TaxID=1871047 RepID=UPI00388FE8F7
MKYNLKTTIQSFQKKEKLKFLFFWGDTTSSAISKSCFSQWYPCEFEENSQKYFSAEQYMMASKAALFNDDKALKEILDTKDPKKAKALGRLVKNFNAENWDQHKYEIVVQANYLKFSQNEEFKNFLCSTNQKILVEASPNDKIWGIGMLESNPKSENPLLWNGENLLGFALMEVRDSLQ